MNSLAGSLSEADSSNNSLERTNDSPERSKLNQMNVEQKKALLEQLLKQKIKSSEKAFNLSKGQEALWFVEQSAAPNCAYNVASAMRIYSAIDTGVLEKALVHCINRHAALKVCFDNSQTLVQQKYIHTIDFSLQREDVTHLNDDAISERVYADYEKPFNLNDRPLVRAKLYQRDHGETLFLMVVHHIVFDATSLWLLMDEIGKTYQSLIQDNEIPNLPKVDNYFSFVAEQEKYIASDAGQEARDYWTKKLAGDHLPLTLDIANSRPPIQTHEGESHYFTISAELGEKVKELAKTQGTTAYAVLLSAFYCLLAKHTGQQDIAIISPTSGRVDRRFMSTVGYFVNPVVMRSNVNEELPFSIFLEHVKNTVLEGLAYQQYPFSSVVEALNPKRDASYTPLSQVSFVFQNAQKGEGLFNAWAPGKEGPVIDWFGLKAAQYPLRQQEGQFELELEVVEASTGLVGIFKYNTSIFTKANIALLEGHFTYLLEQILESPARKISDLCLLTVAEKRQLDAWNETEKNYHSPQVLHKIIEENVENNPDNIAVVFDGIDYTYRDINARANRLAHYLLKECKANKEMIAVCMDRSVEMVISLLAIIKSGCAYVPVDPNYPTDRVRFLLEDSQSTIVLTQNHLLKSLPEVKAQWITVGTLDLDSAHPAYCDKNPDVDIAGSDIAYTIYTSGSTGNPKGAMNSHAGICNRLIWMQDEYQLNENDVVLQKTPFSFDVSVWEFFWPLMVGAKLVVAKPEGHKDTHYLIDTIKLYGVTTLHFVPSMLNSFLMNSETETCTSLKRVICSGEALSYSLQKKFFNVFSCELHNLYGPTEAAIDVTYWACDSDYAANIVPIGKPIANIRTYVLDECMQQVPVGINGQLYIGGVGVARGYHNRPELTASRFLPDPFSDDPNALLYKTGDLVRYREDGNIEYLQRIDNQVKLRGFRIELGEIESTICQNERIHDAVVTLQQDSARGDYLVAYIVLNNSEADVNAIQESTFSLLKKFLGEKLPAHCIPAAIMELDAIPLTANGKVNYKALPQYSYENTQHNDRLMPPRTSVERTLLSIWQTLLKLDKISITDNFFSLGGHSLLAVQMMAEIEKQFTQKLPLSALMQNPSIEKLAEKIQQNDVDQDEWSALVKIQDKGSQTPMFFVPGGGGNVLYFYALAEAMGEDQPFYALQSIGLDGKTQPIASAMDIANNIVHEIKSERPNGPYIIGGHCVGGLVAYLVASQLVALGDEVENLIILDAPAPHFFTPKSIALNDAAWAGVLVDTIAQMTGLSFNGQESFQNLESELAILNALSQCLEKANMLPVNTPIEQVKGLLNVFKVNAQLHYDDSLNKADLPITLMRAATTNPHYDYSQYDDCSDVSASTIGWKQYANEIMNICLVPGDHITILSPENAHVLAEKIQTTHRTFKG